MTTAEHPWGRVDAEGTVFVKTGDSEREIGEWKVGDPAEGLAFYVRRFEGLETEVDLLEKRLASGALSPDEAAKAVAKVRGEVTDAAAIGDLASLEARLDALAPAIEKQREERRAEREAKVAEATVAKTRIVEEAEKIAAGQDWRAGADRLRELLEEWKALPRLSKSADDQLWHRFSAARTAYTRKRKAHFAEQNTQREAAQKVKEKLIAEAEALSSSTEWGPTSGAYRDLMTRWKAAGSAPRNVEDKLWKRFRAAQDVFFQARDAANAALDEEFAANAVVKEQLLVEAEALLPVTDLDKARRALNDIADRWEAAGKVPRGRVKELEGRLRTVEQAVRAAGEQEWKRSDPEKSARADDMIGKLQRAIDETREALTKARVVPGDGAEGRRRLRLSPDTDRSAGVHRISLPSVVALLGWRGAAPLSRPSCPGHGPVRRPRDGRPGRHGLERPGGAPDARAGAGRRSRRRRRPDHLPERHVSGAGRRGPRPRAVACGDRLGLRARSYGDDLAGPHLLRRGGRPTVGSRAARRHRPRGHRRERPGADAL